MQPKLEASRQLRGHERKQSQKYSRAMEDQPQQRKEVELQQFGTKFLNRGEHVFRTESNSVERSNLAFRLVVFANSS